jgi:hypothetical protein
MAGVSLGVNRLKVSGEGQAQRAVPTGTIEELLLYQFIANCLMYITAFLYEGTCAVASVCMYMLFEATIDNARVTWRGIASG